MRLEGLEAKLLAATTFSYALAGVAVGHIAVVAYGFDAIGDGRCGFGVGHYVKLPMYLTGMIIAALLCMVNFRSLKQTQACRVERIAPRATAPLVAQDVANS